MKSNKGFSLVELVVVIGLKAIIAGVAIPVYNGYIDKANKAVDERLLENIEQALIYAFAMDVNGQLPCEGFITVGKYGVINSPDKTTPAFYNILAASGLVLEGLKFDGWNSAAEVSEHESPKAEFTMFMDENEDIDTNDLYIFFNGMNIIVIFINFLCW